MEKDSTDTPPYMKADDRVILFDGVCKLCSAWANFVIHHDHGHCFKLASVQSRAGEAILKYFNYPVDVYETMLVVDGHRVYEKSDAFFFVMRTLGYPWRLVLLFKFIPHATRDWLYDRVALNRYKLFGRYHQCRLPSPDHERRYLDGA